MIAPSLEVLDVLWSIETYHDVCGTSSRRIHDGCSDFGEQMVGETGVDAGPRFDVYLPSPFNVGWQRFVVLRRHDAHQESILRVCQFAWSER